MTTEEFADLHDELLRIADDPSGAARAREAHEAGAVAPLESRPLHDVWIHFAFHGDEGQAHAVVGTFVETLWERGSVTTPVDTTVKART